MLCKLTGGEYQPLSSFFKRIGIKHLLSCPHAHQQNGSAERKHRHIIEMGLTHLAHASMPLKFWDEAFLTAVFLINRLPSKVINHETPLVAYTVRNRTTPSYGHLGVRCGPIFLHITHASSNFVSNGACFLAIAIPSKGSSVLIRRKAESIYPKM